MNYIFDIDGTLADCSHRLHFIQGIEKDFDAFYDACDDDTPIYHSLELLKTLSEHGNVYFLTARPERSRQKTLCWLLKHTGIDVINDCLYMQKDDERRQDYVVKLENLNKMNVDKNETIIFEDRYQCVKALRENGWVVFQVRENNY